MSILIWLGAFTSGALVIQTKALSDRHDYNYNCPMYTPGEESALCQGDYPAMIPFFIATAAFLFILFTLHFGLSIAACRSVDVRRRDKRRQKRREADGHHMSAAG